MHYISSHLSQEHLTPSGFNDPWVLLHMM